MDFERYLEYMQQPVVAVDRIFQVAVCNAAFVRLFPRVEKGENIRMYFAAYPVLRPLFEGGEGNRALEWEGEQYTARVSFLRSGAKQRPLARCVLLANITETARLVEAANTLGAELLRSNEHSKRLNREIAANTALETQAAAYFAANHLLRDIHDTTGHTLITVWALLRQARDAWPNAVLARQKLDAALSNTKLAIADFASVGTGKGGLTAFMHRFQKSMGEAGLHVQLRICGQELPAHREQYIHLMRICQEAATNSIRHGHATKLYVELCFEPQRTSLLLRDNGRSTGDFKPGLGLTGMDERVNMMFGEFQYYRDTKGGFVIAVTAPVIEDG